MAKPNVRKVVCGNCEWKGTEQEVYSLEFAPRLGERLTAGDEVPAGECPACRAFCYLVKVSSSRPCVGGVR
jgi:hypothetical protein